jgi:hypothetical protein
MARVRGLLIGLLLGLLLAACGGDGPCAGVDDACIVLTVKSSVFQEIDQLDLDILYGDRHDTISTALPEKGRVELPIVTTITLDINTPVAVGVVGAGKLGAAVQGFGAAEKMIGTDEHVTMEIDLATKSTCEIGMEFCGGEGFAGNPQTLYRCTDGVPLARGRCTHLCDRRTGSDVCLAGPEKCTLGGYCGGNEVDGDPGSVYTCMNGVGVNRMQCADGCVIERDNDDHCR